MSLAQVIILDQWVYTIRTNLLLRNLYTYSEFMVSYTLGTYKAMDEHRYVVLHKLFLQILSQTFYIWQKKLWNICCVLGSDTRCANSIHTGNSEWIWSCSLNSPEWCWWKRAHTLLSITMRSVYWSLVSSKSPWYRPCFDQQR